MTRLRLHLRGAWLLLSTTLLCTCAILWIAPQQLTSYSLIRYSISSHEFQHISGVGTFDGMFFAGTMEYEPFSIDPNGQPQFDSGFHLEFGDHRFTTGAAFVVLSAVHGAHGPDWAPFAIASTTIPRGHGNGECRAIHAVAAPLWSLILLLAISPARSIFIAVRRHRRIRNHRCPHCGYDLRFSTDRCPECGQLNPTPLSASSAPPAGP